MAPGEKRTSLLTHMLDQKIRGAHASAWLREGQPEALQVFCEINGIAERQALHVMAQLRKYAKAHDFSDMQSTAISAPTRFSRQKAIQMVADAFEKFDPQMKRDIERAARDGRIIFDPENTPHQDIITEKSVKKMPALAKLNQSHSGKPYVNVPAGENLTLSDCITLAHECGHLCASERYMRKHKNKPDWTPRIMHEVYAELGSELLNDALAEQYASKRLFNRIELEIAQTRDKRHLMFGCANTADAEHALLKYYKIFEERDSRAGFLERMKPESKKRWPEWKKYEESLRSAVKDEAIIGSLLENNDAYYPLAYPIAHIAAHQLFLRWKTGDKAVPKKLGEAAVANMNFGQAMQHLGIDWERHNLVERGIQRYDATEKQVLGRFPPTMFKAHALETAIQARRPRTDLAFAPGSEIAARMDLVLPRLREQAIQRPL